MSRVRSVVVVVVALAMTAAVMSASPSSAAPELAAVKVKPDPKPDKNTKDGKASEHGKALAEAKKTKKRVSVPSEQTETESLFANPDGTYSREKAAAPIRAKNDDGKLAPMDTTLAKKGARLEPKVTTGDVSFTATGAGDLATYQVGKDQSVGVQFDGELGAAKMEESSATYPVTGSEAEQVRVAALPDGFVSHVELSEAPTEAPTYTFILDLKGLTAELTGNRLELSDDKGTLVAASRPLRMWDAARDSAGDPSNVQNVDASLVEEGGVTKLELRPSMEYLSDPETQFPVVVDPDVAKVEDRGDTFYFEGQSASDSKGSDYRLITGYASGATHRSLVTFGYEEYMGQTVTDATLRLRQYSSETCDPKKSEFFAIVSDIPGSITWATRPDIEDSDRFEAEGTFNHGQSGDGCPDAYEDIDVTNIVTAWAGGALNSDTAGLDRQGIEIRADHEQDPDYQKRFCSLNLSGSDSLNCNDSDYIPRLSVSYVAELGDQDWYSMTGHKLNDRSALAVNNETGNLLVTADDAKVNARGVPFAASRTYNSQAQSVSSLGKGWNLSLGADVWLEKKSEFRYDYHAPDGTVFGSFIRKTSDPSSSVYDNFITPLGGVGADLDQDPEDNEFVLTFHDSQMLYRFTPSGPDGHAYLTRVVDRSSNHMDLTYSGTTSTGTPKLSSITDAAGRDYAITYTGDYISKISESDGLGRDWTYAYTNGYLTSYTDAAGKTTNYDYTSGFIGPELLSQVQDPVSSTGSRPTTNVEYGYDSRLKTDEVTKVKYVLDASTTYEWSWRYYDDEDDAGDPGPGEDGTCEEHGDIATEVTDPNNATSTFCFRPRGEGKKMKTWVYDGEEREVTEEFNADHQDDLGTSGLTGSTVKTYGASLPDQLKTVREPESDSGVAKLTSIDYEHDFSGGGQNDPKGEDYLPSSVTDPNGDCTRYQYDTTGRVTAAITGLRGSGSDRSCAQDLTGGFRYYLGYNSDGTVNKMADANSGSSPTDSEKTLYDYWQPGETGYVAGTVGMLQAVREPSGDCSAAGSGRQLCTSYTYDAAGRVKTITDGRGIVTTMAYDDMDRTTSVFFNGATSCGAGNSNCVEYVYDDEGNLTSRAGQAGTTTFGYDRMNRPTTRSEPGGVSMAMSYDGASNLTGYEQAIGSATDEVTYTYDAGNVVDKINDSSGQINVDANDDAIIEQIFLPGPGGLKFDLDFDDSGKVKRATARTGGTTGPKLREYTYDYTEGNYDRHQLQSRQTSYAGSGLNGTITYNYDAARIDSAVDSSSGGIDYYYNHDNIGNVTAENTPAVKRYSGYDRAGQLCWTGSTVGTYLGTDCPMGPAGSTLFEHDEAGNNLNTAAEPTDYNDQNQVTELGGLVMDYLDLGNDLRTQAGPTQMVNGPLGISATKAGSQVTWYTRMPDGTILDAREPGGATQYYFTEPHNKSVAALYSPAGAKVGSYEYSPYGETTVDAETGGSIADENPFRYISGFQDTEGAEDYYKLGARYYDGHGHFSQPDPVPGTAIKPRTMTAYNYAFGDPINHSDPSGRCVFGWSCPEWAGKVSFKSVLGAVDKATVGADAAGAIYAVVYTDWSSVMEKAAGLVGGGSVGAACAWAGVTGPWGLAGCFVVGVVVQEYAEYTVRRYGPK